MYKILHINSYFYESIFYQNLFNKQISNGEEISVFVPANNHDNIDKYKDLPYVSINNIYNKMDRFFYHHKQRKIIKTLEEEYTISEFDLIHAHSVFTNGYSALKMYKKYNIPYIVAVRNTDINIFFRRMPHLRNVGIEILKNAKKIVYISPAYMYNGLTNYVSKELFDSLLRKSVVIPNGLDQFWLDNTNYKYDKVRSMTKLNVLTVGKICKLKNMAKVAEACQILKGEGVDVQLTVVGKIEDKRVAKKIAGYDFVKIFPFMPKEDLIDIYRASDIFVLPSLRETFGLVYAEAMTQAIPVIYTKNQGFDGQFEEGEVGFSVNPQDSKDIVKAIKCCINNRDELKENCIRLCRKFSWDLIVMEYHKIYEDCFNTINGEKNE